MRMTSLFVLLLALSAHPQEKSKDKDKDKVVQDQTVPKGPVKDWTWRRTDTRFDPKTKKDVEELTVIIRGKEAIPVLVDPVDRTKKIFDLRGVKANYFTTPDKDEISKEIVMEADQGRYDHAARTLRLKDNVRVVKKNGDEQPPLVDTVLTASSAVLRFNRMFECSTCQTPLKAPGRCVLHNETLKEMTVTNLEIESEFELTGPEGIVTGDGLVTDDEFRREYHIRKNGFVEFGGDASTLVQGRKSAPDPRANPQPTFTQIFSRGPLRITGDEYRRQIVGEGGVRVDRIDSSGSLTMHAEKMAIDSLRVHDPRTMKLGAPDVRVVDAQGKVRLDGVMFEDGTVFQTTSDSLERRLVGDLEHITLKSSEIPVHVKSGPNTIEARTVRITRKEGATGGVSEFESVLRSDLVAGDQHFSLKADHLTTTAEPNAAGRTDLHTLLATGHVVLGGLMPGRPGSTTDTGEAHADRFDWDLRTQKGILEATPFVRITQGPSVIVAPLVVLESSKLFVLKGPKQVTLVKDGEKEKEVYRATCEGDMVLDNSSNRLWMRNECVIRTNELTLKADRVNALLSKDGGGLESLTALGRVRAARRADQSTVYGERLAYRFKDQELTIYGAPYAWADTGRSMARQESIRVFEKENPKTKQKIRYTQMDGGPDGLRIEIDDRGKPGEPLKLSGKPADPPKHPGNPK
jgi:lipopolysaccharide export system protein LptA